MQKKSHPFIEHLDFPVFHIVVAIEADRLRSHRMVMAPFARANAQNPSLNQPGTSGGATWDEQRVFETWLVVRSGVHRASLQAQVTAVAIVQHWQLERYESGSQQRTAADASAVLWPSPLVGAGCGPSTHCDSPEENSLPNTRY